MIPMPEPPSDPLISAHAAHALFRSAAPPGPPGAPAVRRGHLCRAPGPGQDGPGPPDNADDPDGHGARNAVAPRCLDAVPTAPRSLDRSHRQGLARCVGPPQQHHPGCPGSQWRKPPVRTVERRRGGKQDPGFTHGPDGQRTGEPAVRHTAPAHPVAGRPGTRQQRHPSSGSRVPAAGRAVGGGRTAPHRPADRGGPAAAGTGQLAPETVPGRQRVLCGTGCDATGGPEVPRAAHGRGGDHRQRWEQRLRGRRPGLPGPGPARPRPGMPWRQRAGA